MIPQDVRARSQIGRASRNSASMASDMLSRSRSPGVDQHRSKSRQRLREGLSPTGERTMGSPIRPD